MKAIVSSTFDSKYFFFLPIVTWAWNKLGVEVICFLPYSPNVEIETLNKVPSRLMEGWLEKYNLKCELHYFNAPQYKQATYAQCSRLYGACLDLPEDEVLVIGDVDMLNFKIPIPNQIGDRLSVLGFDLVPEGQVPMCYVSGTVKGWRNVMQLNYGSMSAELNSLAETKIKTYQQSLDELLGDIECENMRGNYWSKDQQELASKLFDSQQYNLISRARKGTQFAENRIDRDDSYFMDRLSFDVIDYHAHRPGYTEDNFEKIMNVIRYFYPLDDLQWIYDYRNEYLKIA